MTSFQCRGCGATHEGLPYSYHFHAPAYWSAELEDDSDSILGEEQCIVRGEHFFVRALIRIPVLDGENDFEWGVWVSLSETSFDRMTELWEQPGRESEEPYFGWLSSKLPTYSPSTINLATLVHTSPVGVRPTVELEPGEHPLVLEQQRGITVARVEELASTLMH